MDNNNFVITLSYEEKLRCLEEIISKLKKVVHVYEKTQEPNSNYNYRVFCGGIAIYVSSANILFNGELVNILINLNAILTNSFDKEQIKKLVFESINFANYLYSKYQEKEGEEEIDNGSY